MEHTQTEYHGGFFYIERIHRILALLNEVTARRTNDARQMAQDLRVNYNLLNDLFKELSPKMHKDDKLLEDHKEAAKKLKADLEKAINGYATNQKLPMQLEADLDEWERELRTFADKKGLLVPDKQDARGAAYG